MNPCNSWMETDPARKAQLERIEALADALGNPDALAATEAADRLMEGRAAFWSTSGYSDQFTSRAMTCANMTGDLREALISINWRRRGAEAAEDMLDQLIPLGQIAVQQLVDAYERLGTFRSRREICAREAAAVTPLPVLQAAE